MYNRILDRLDNWWRFRFRSQIDIDKVGKLLENVFNSSFDAIILLDGHSIIDCNHRALVMFGCSKQQLIGKSPKDLSPEFQPNGEPSERSVANQLQHIANEGQVVFEWWHQKFNGDLFLALITANSFLHNGEYYLMATMRDITTQRQEEEELKNHRLNLEMLVREKTRQIEEKNQNLHSLNIELDRANFELQASYQELASTNEELLTINEKLNDLNQKLEDEIEGHKHTIEEKEILEEKLKQFIFQSANGIMLANEDGIVEEWNESLEVLTGVTRREALGKYVWDIDFLISALPGNQNSIQQKGKEKTVRFFFDIQVGHPQKYTLEIPIHHKDQSFRTVHLSLFPIITNYGNYAGVILIDVTEIKRTEDELKRSKHQLETLLKKNTERYVQLSERFNELYHNSSDAITLIDILEDGKRLKVFDMNPVAFQLFHLHPDQLKESLYLSDFISPEILHSFILHLLPSIIKGDTCHINEPEFLNGGYWTSTFYPIRDPEGKVYRIAFFSKNVTTDIEKEKIAAMLNSVVENWPFEVWICNSLGECIVQNQASLKHWGDLHGKRFEELDMPLDLKQESQVGISKALNGEETKLNLCLNTSVGLRYVLFNLHPIVSNGQLNGYLGLGIDLTEHKLSEAKIRASEESYRLLAENIDDVIFKYDLIHQCFTYVSPSVFKLRGFTVEETLGQSLNEVLVSDDFEKVSALMKERMDLYCQGDEQALTFRDELRIRHKDGPFVWIEMISTLMLNPEGTISEMIATSRNIDHRKQIESALRESEERFRSILQLSKHLIYEYHLQSDTIQWDGAIEEITGFTPEEYKGVGLKQWGEMIHPDERDLIMAEFNESLRLKKPFHAHYRYRNKMNYYRWIEEDSHVMLDGDQSARFLGIMKDITEQKLAQEKLNESEYKLRTIFNASKDGIILLDLQLSILDVNPAIEKKTLVNKDKLIGLKFSDFIPDDSFIVMQSHFDQILKGQLTSNFESLITLNSNEIIPVEISVNMIQLNQQDALLLMIRDISERKQMERRLLTSVIQTEEKERLHFSQELHDGLGPLLSAAKMYVDWLEKPRANIQQEELIPDIKKLLEEAGNSIREVSFKLSPHILQNYGLMEAVKAYCDKIREKSQIAFQIEGQCNFRFDETVETIVFRVICESVHNTIKHAGASLIRIQMEVDPTMLIVNYFDNGKGFDIEKAMLARKGIGLLNMQSRIKSINGQFTIYSQPGEGTHIVVKTPLDRIP